MVCRHKSLQDLLLRRLSAEFEDLLIIRARNADNAIDIASGHRFEAVVCSWVDYTEELYRFFLGKESTFIVFFKDSSKELLELPKRVQLIRLDADWDENLSACFRLKCSPEQRRQSHRYHVPGLTALFESEYHQVTAPVVNFNSQGLLLQMNYRPEDAHLVHGATVTLEFPPSYPHTLIPRVRARLVRLNVLEREATLPTVVRLAFVFCEVSIKQMLAFNENITTADQECA